MNKVFIAVSLDGCIADDKGSVDFLYKYPDIPGEDMGYYSFMSSIDALVMGRKTFETVLGFGVEWPYQKPVFVWSTQLQTVPLELKDKVFLINGTVESILLQLKKLNYHHLYIDGGKTIQSFLNEDLIDEMIITTVPVLLGKGIKLFDNLGMPLYFTCTSSKNFANGLTQSCFVKKD